MKKHLSVLGLYARFSVYKLLVIIAAMCFIEGIIYSYTPDAADLTELLKTINHIGFFFRVPLILTTLVLCRAGTQYSSKTGYTLRRLSVSEPLTFVYQAVYNTLTYLVLWAVQTAVAYTAIHCYIADAESALGNQTVFITFYSTPFLHSLLPLSDVLLWIRNIALFAALGTSAAYFTYMQRRDAQSVPVIIIAAYIMLLFNIGMGKSLHCIVFSVLLLLIIGYMTEKVFNKEECKNE